VTAEALDWSQYEAVVEKNWAYYRPRFERFARGGWYAWNWAAFFATFAWLRYRRLYAWSWLYFFFSMPFLIFVSLVAKSGDACERALEPQGPDVTGMAVFGLMVLGWIVPPLVANRIYYAHVRDMVGAISKWVGTGGFVGSLFLQASVVLLPAMALASYASYLYRAKVSEGISLAASAKAPVQEYFNDQSRLPAKIEEVVGTTSGKYVQSLVLGKDGTIKAVFGAGGQRLAGHTVSMVPAKQDGKIASWTCRSDDLPNQCLPAACRRE
jgi:type IV pilus assembly protein PilA